MINIVVRSVPGSRERAHFKLTDADHDLVIRDLHLLLGDSAHLSPEPLHFIAENARRRFHQTRWINEVTSAARMDMNRRAQLGETPRRARVIEMDMAEKNVAHIVRREIRRAHRGREILEGRVRPGIEEGDAVVRLERGDGDDAGPAEMLRVENVDHCDC